MLLDYIFKPFVQIGTLRIIDSCGKTHVFIGNKDKESPNLDVTIRLHNKQIERQFLLEPQLALGEGYTKGTITLEQGNLYDLLELGAKNLFLKPKPGLLHKMFNTLANGLSYIKQHNPIWLAQKQISHHYDLNEEFIHLFLDKDLQYSCAYFKSKEDSLETAQENKKRHIAQKLLIQPGQRILDIGSGWGGMALYLASHYDVEVVGLTLSKEQLAVSIERARQMHLSDRVKFYLRDYREEKGSYDRIVSVGMFEHVGIPQYPIYFKQAHQLLKEDGLMLLHSIGIAAPPRPTSAWIRKYIFPGGYCPSISEVIPKIENVGFYITDIEILRYHYAYTLMHWREQFMKNRKTACELYNEEFCRMWEYYLTACEVGFRYQDLMVFQMQLSRSKDIVPITRDYLYSPDANIAHAYHKNPVISAMGG